MNPLADDQTSLAALIQGDYKISLVVRSIGSLGGWKPLHSEYNTAMSLIPVEIGSVPDGQYELGLEVTCYEQTFLSDTMRGSIDRSAPQVKSTTPAEGGAVDSQGTVEVLFNEPVDCSLSLATLTVGALEQAVAIECDGAQVTVQLTDEQVRLVWRFEYPTIFTSFDCILVALWPFIKCASCLLIWLDFFFSTRFCWAHKRQFPSWRLISPEISTTTRFPGALVCTRGLAGMQNFMGLMRATLVQPWFLTP